MRARQYGNKRVSSDLVRIRAPAPRWPGRLPTRTWADTHLSPSTLTRISFQSALTFAWSNLDMAHTQGQLDLACSCELDDRRADWRR